MKEFSKLYIFSILVILILVNPNNSCAKSANKYLTKEYQEFPDSIKDMNKRPFFGLAVSGGLSLSTGYYTYKSGLEPPAVSILYTPTASLGMDLRFGKVFSVRSDLRYHTKGDYIKINKLLDNGEEQAEQGDWITLKPVADGYIQTKASYFEISLVPTFHLGDWVHVGAGAYAGIGLFGNEKSDFTIEYYEDDFVIDQYSDSLQRTIQFVFLNQEEDTDEIRYFNLLDYGLVALLGFGHKPITIDFTMQYGLETWQEETNVFNYPINPDKTQHLSLMITVSYWFL